MKKFTAIVTTLKTVIKYSAILFVVVEIIQFAIEKFEALDLKSTENGK